MFDRLTAGERQIIEQAQAVVPVPLGDIAARLGLRVKAATLPVGISGEIRPSGNAFEIKVNRHDSRGRQRFTVAHELAHYLLHRSHIGDGVTDDALYRSGLSDAREAEANRLAAQILMPEASLRLALQGYAGPDEEKLSTLAGIFGVSEAAMGIRLEQIR